MNERWKTVAWIIGICVLVALFVFNHDSSSSSSGYDSYSPPTSNRFYGGDNSGSSEHTIDRDEAISDHWDEIKDYLSGSETINACSSESGNCYDLDANISDGQVEEIYFPNTGYLYFSADIDSDGEASDYDNDGNEWDFTLDMDSLIVDDAISDWASDNDYTID